MKSGICPKCSSREIYQSSASPRSSDRVTLKDGLIGQDASSVTRYVCTECGYLEYYLAAHQDLAAVRTHWERTAT